MFCLRRETQNDCNTPTWNRFKMKQLAETLRQAVDSRRGILQM